MSSTGVIGEQLPIKKIIKTLSNLTKEKKIWDGKVLQSQS